MDVIRKQQSQSLPLNMIAAVECLLPTEIPAN